MFQHGPTRDHVPRAVLVEGDEGKDEEAAGKAEKGRDSPSQQRVAGSTCTALSLAAHLTAALCWVPTSDVLGDPTFDRGQEGL
jgi:hypothetical protein